MTSGEKSISVRLENKLQDDCLLWYDVPVGPKQSHPDFVGIQIQKTVPPELRYIATSLAE